MERLSNERWGFSSNCFVCEPTNAVGLRQRFFHDTDADLVVADIELGSDHSGAPSYVHGGVQLALLDEAMAWAAIAVAERFAVTASFTSTFHHPIKIDRAYRLEASIDRRTDTTLSARLGSSTTRDGLAPRPRPPWSCSLPPRRSTPAPRSTRRRTASRDRDRPRPPGRAPARRCRRLPRRDVPLASLASRLASGGAVDLRTAGSGNPGALNAAQQLGTAWGVGVLIADAAKGRSGRWPVVGSPATQAPTSPPPPASPGTSHRSGAGSGAARASPRRPGRASRSSRPTSRSMPLSPLPVRRAPATRRPPRASRRWSGRSAR